MSERPYSRVYWSVRTDPKFAPVYGDDHHFATWVRLLMLAEGTWPEPADLPARARRGSVKALSDAEIIDLLPGGMYRVHGLDKERNGRSEQARAAVRTRYDRTTPVAQNGYDRTTRRDETSKDEQRRDEARERADIEAFIVARHRLPTPAQRDLLDDYCLVFDVTGPERAARLILEHPDDPIGAVKADLAEHRAARLEVAVAQEQESIVRHREDAPRYGLQPGSTAYAIAQEIVKLDREEAEA